MSPMAVLLPEPMRRALVLAADAGAAGEVPVGAVVTRGTAIVGEGRNATRSGCDPTAHAEIVALRAAARALADDRLVGCVLWVTLEPCAMCTGALVNARIDRLVYGAPDPKGGSVDHGARILAHPGCLHRPEVVGGIGEAASAELLRVFFASRRAKSVVAPNDPFCQNARER